MPTPTGLPVRGEQYRHTKTHRIFEVVERRGNNKHYALVLRPIDGEPFVAVHHAFGYPKDHMLMTEADWWLKREWEPVTLRQPPPVATMPQTPERTMLGVVVVIAGERPYQVETWKEALEFVASVAQGDDPVHVSMFTLYWPAPGEED